MRFRIVIFFMLICSYALCDSYQYGKPIIVKLCTQDMARPNIPVYIKKRIVVEAKYTMIIYVDKGDCPPCFISHLYEWEIFMKDCRKFNIPIKFMFVFSPPETGQSSFISTLSTSPISYLSYIDIRNKFKNNNPWIINAPSKHRFIIDEKMRPIFMDEPPYNRETMMWLRSL